MTRREGGREGDREGERGREGGREREKGGRYSAIQGPFEKGKFPPSGRLGCKMERKERQERRQQRIFLPLLQPPFHCLLPSLPLHPLLPTSFPATFVFHCFHPFSAQQSAAARDHCSAKTWRICPRGGALFSAPLSRFRFGERGRERYREREKERENE